MKNGKFIKIFAGAVIVLAVGLSAVFGGCAGKDGRDGANGKDLNIYDIYAAVKAESGNENLTLEEFLKEYLSYTPAEIEEAVSLRAAVNRSLLSGVSIRAEFFERSTGNTVYSGSGVILDVDRENGDMTVATNCHVVYSSKANFSNQDGFSDNVMLWLYGSEYIDKCAVKAEIVAASKAYDIAVLKVEGSDIVKNSYAVKAEWAGGEEVYLGEQVYAIGNANGEKLSASVGYISKDMETVTVDLGDPEPYNYKVMRTSANINAGNSGGGLYNLSGQLVGLINAKGRDEAVGVGYALPSANVKRVVDRMLRGYAGNGSEAHGVTVANHGITVDVKDSYTTGLNDKGFAEIVEVVTVSSMSYDGKAFGSLETGDRIAHVKVTRPSGESTEVVEDMDIRREHNFHDALLSVDVGCTAEITVIRGGEEKTFAFTFDETDFRLK